MQMEKETFILRTEWYESIQELDEKSKAELLDNLFLFHLNEETKINLNNLMVKLVWKLIEPNLRRNIESYDKRNLELLPTYVYYIILTKNSESFIKIGISSNVKERYSNYRHAGFSVQEIKIECFDSRSQALLHESKIHAFLKDFKLFPVQKFSGYTECFSINSINILP